MCSLKLSAQTKDETIKWITEKINTYGKQSRAVEQGSGPGDIMITADPKMFEVKLGTSATVEGNHIIVIQHFYSKDGTESEAYSFSVSFDDISGASNATETPSTYRGHINLLTTARKVKFIKYTNYTTGTSTAAPTSNTYARDKTVIPLTLDWTTERDLYNRLCAAFAKLISYNTRETF